MVQPELELSTLRIGDVIDGRYEVRGHLGSGGMGDVWLVQHRELMQEFALKTLKPEMQHSEERVQRFVREARSAAALRSRHIVRVVDGRTDYQHRGAAFPFIVMEYLQGLSVEQRVALYGPCSTAEATWLMSRLGLALKAAHDSGLVHRDVKPANIFVANGEDGEPTVKLGDFGVVKLMDEGLSADSAMTASGTLVGTPMYMAPEQLRGQRKIGPEADQWSLAMVAYYLVVGDCYFADSESMADLIAAALGSQWTRPSKKSARFPAALDSWFLRSCHQRPEQRYPDVEQQVREFELLLGKPNPVPIMPRQANDALTDAAAAGGGAAGAVTEGGVAGSAITARALAEQPWLSWWALTIGILIAVVVTTWVWSQYERAAGMLFERQEARISVGPGLSVLAPPQAAASQSQAPGVAVPTNEHVVVDSSRAVPSVAEVPSSANAGPSASNQATSKSLAESQPAKLPVSSQPGRLGKADKASKAGEVGTVSKAAQVSKVGNSGTVRKAGTVSKYGAVAPTASPKRNPASSRPPRRASGESCARSAECQSGMCVAEVCR